MPKRTSLKAPARAAWFASAALLLAAACDGGEGATSTDAAAQNAAQESALRVTVREARRAALSERAELAGQSEALRVAAVAAERPARVVRRYVEPGDAVTAGMPLLALDAELALAARSSAQAQVQARAADFAEAKRALARGEKLHGEGALSAERLDSLRFGMERAEAAQALAQAELRRARRLVRDSKIRAPFAGSVEQVHLQVGDFAKDGQPAAVVADFSRVRLRVFATAQQADGLRAGRRVRVGIPATGAAPRAAEIRSVGRMPNPESGAYPLELWLDNSDGRLRAGMTAYVLLEGRNARRGVIIPRAALMRREGRLMVFVVEGQGAGLRAAARRVTLGRQGEAEVEAASGVAAGERVVVEGMFTLTDGTPVAIDAMPPAAAQTTPEGPGP